MSWCPKELDLFLSNVFQLHLEPDSDLDARCACTLLLIRHPSAKKSPEGKFTDRIAKGLGNNFLIVAFVMFFYFALLISYYIRNGSLKPLHPTQKNLIPRSSTRTPPTDFKECVSRRFVAIFEIHRWARSIQRMDGVFGDVRAAESTLIRKRRKARVEIRKLDERSQRYYPWRRDTDRDRASRGMIMFLDYCG